MIDDFSPQTTNRLLSPELEGPLFRRYGIELDAGRYLFRENELGREMFVLLMGQISIRIALQDGTSQELALLDGDLEDESPEHSSSRIIGEMSILESRPRSASALAVTRCRLIRVDEPTFYSMLRYNAQFALEFMKVLSYRLRAANENRGRMGGELSRLRGRLIRAGTAARIAQYVDENGEKASFTMLDIMDSPGAGGLTADQLSEGMSWLNEAGIIELDEGRVEVRNLAFCRTAAALVQED